MINVENLSVYSSKKSPNGAQFKNIIINNITLNVEKGRAFCLTGEDSKAKKLLLRLVQKANPEGVFVEDYLSRTKIAPISDVRPFGDWTVMEFFIYNASSLKCGKAAIVKYSNECLSRVGLAKYAGKKIKSLSRAEFVLMQIALNLWGNPESVIIDAGCIKPSKKEKKKFNKGIELLKKQGIAILVGAHPKLAGSAFNAQGAFGA